MTDDALDIGLQQLSPAKLGRLIALVLTQSSPEQLPKFGETLNEKELGLRNAVQEFMQSRLPSEQSADWQDLLAPEPCGSEGSLLLRKPQILLALFRDQNTAALPEPPLCERFFHHLNSCFLCFEHYTEVMQSFYLTYSELHKKNAAAKKK